MPASFRVRQQPNIRSATCLPCATGTDLSPLIKFFMAETIFQEIASKGADRAQPHGADLYSFRLNGACRITRFDLMEAFGSPALASVVA
jgi:hypothetical protein